MLNEGSKQVDFEQIIPHKKDDFIRCGSLLFSGKSIFRKDEMVTFIVYSKSILCLEIESFFSTFICHL